MALTVSSPKTFARKIATFAGLGLAGVILYVGVELASAAKVQREYDDRIVVLRETMKKDVEMAQNIFFEFKEKNILKPGDKSILELELERTADEYKHKEAVKRKVASLDSLMQKKEFEKANMIIEDVKREGAYKPEEIDSFKMKVYLATEEGLRYAWSNSQATDVTRIQNSKRYLKMYPNGQFKKEAIENVIIYEVTTLTKDADSDKKTFEERFFTLRELNDDLVKYSGEGISLKGIIDVNEIKTRIQSYADNTSMVPEKSIEKGSTVKVIWAKDMGWDQTYLDERNKTIPFGSIGEVIDFGPNQEVFVRFQDIKEYHWKHEWGGDKNYWKSNEKNVGSYKIQELKATIPEEDIQKQRFLKEADKLEKNLRSYM